ncbi:MAG TPA: hypothetical protein VE988_04715 [Gemmataceae bacterium]|nr:hypothetical protein [Gemmataceae bacterium]
MIPSLPTQRLSMESPGLSLSSLTAANMFWTMTVNGLTAYALRHNGPAAIGGFGSVHAACQGDADALSGGKARMVGLGGDTV